MRRDDVRLSVAARDDGLRRVRRLTAAAGAVGVTCSAVAAVAFSHQHGWDLVSLLSRGSGPSVSQSPAGGGQVAPGDGGGADEGGYGDGGGAPQPPAQNLAPASGGGHAVSGGS